MGTDVYLLQCRQLIESFEDSNFIRSYFTIGLTEQNDLQFLEGHDAFYFGEEVAL